MVNSEVFLKITEPVNFIDFIIQRKNKKNI